MKRPGFTLPLSAVVACFWLLPAVSPSHGAPAVSRRSEIPEGEGPSLEGPKKGSVPWKRRNPARILFAGVGLPVGRPAAPVITLRNLHTGELLSMAEGTFPSPALVDRFLRCRWTHRHMTMEPRLLLWVLEAAAHFQSHEVHVVSAFRHSKFNEVLRKKGREVAPRSLHRLGQAIDFRLVGVEVERLFAYLKKRRLGGVGRYPQSDFVHLDTGPVRTWGGR